MEHVVNRLILCPKIIGRTSEFATLRSLVEQAREGKGHIALIAGEAGLGKSRLVSELKTTAMNQGFLVVQGACFPTDLTYPYAPLLDLLRSLVASKPEAPLAAAVETLARDIFPLLPELVPDQTILPLQLEHEQEKRRLFAVLATFFLRLSAQAPLLLVIEDAHWCDDTSLEFLHYLARRATSQPLLLLITYRSDEIRSELSSWLAQFDRERLAQEVRLLPLARNEIDTMLSAIFEEQHTSIDMRRFLHGELLDMLYTLTEGNPFFVEETLSSLIAAGDFFYVQGYWNRRSGSTVSIPRSVQDAVQQRIAQVGEASRHVLTLSAVAGRQFDFSLLQQLTHYDEHQLLRIMKELVSAQLVVEESADQFAFRHALTRQAIYNRLLGRERHLLHKTIAETMEQQSSVASDLHLEDLAYHFYQARAWEKAFDYAQRAGEKALSLYAHRAAIDYFTWALEAAEHLSLPPTPALYRARGQANETLGKFEQAQQNYTQAMDAARKGNNRAAEWQSAIDLGFLWAARDYAQAETWFRQALNLSQALNDPALHARSLNRIGNWNLNVEQSQEALRYHKEALAIFQQLHDFRGIAETLDLLGMTSYLDGDLIGGTAFYRQATALFGELGDKAGLTSSLATLSLRAPTFQTDALVSEASLAEAYQDAERSLAVAREIGRRSSESYALFQLGLCVGSQGNYGRAFEVVRRSLNIAEESEHRQWQTANHVVLGGMYSALLAYPRAREHFEHALALARETGSLIWIRLALGFLASVTILLGELAAAEKMLHPALHSDVPHSTMAQRLIWCAAVELSLAQGNPTRALELLDQMCTSDVQRQSSLRILKLYGETLVALKRPAEAEGALKKAQEIADIQGARPMQWRICIALGNLYRTQGRNAEAEQEYATARALIDELAATVPDEALHEDFLQRATALFPLGSAASPRQTTKQSLLTAREREVAALIAQGKSNKEIADRLIVTKRTVETHIGNILFKLSCTSRTQIAVWAVETGLPEVSEGYVAQE